MKKIILTLIITLIGFGLYAQSPIPDEKLPYIGKVFELDSIGGELDSSYIYSYYFGLAALDTSMTVWPIKMWRVQRDVLLPYDGEWDTVFAYTNMTVPITHSTEAQELFDYFWNGTTKTYVDPRIITVAKDLKPWKDVAWPRKRNGQ